MINVFQDMLRSLEDPGMQHAAVVHLPIGLAFIGIAFALASALASRSSAMRWSVVLLYIALAFAAWLATQSGEDAHALMTRNQPAAAHTIIDHHEELATKIWIFALGTAGLFMLSAIETPILRRGAAWLGVTATLFTAGWVAVTGHHGGTAVYEYAVGTANPMTSEDVQGRGTEAGDATTVEAFEASGFSEREAFFLANVKPILDSSCQRCHNPDRAHRSGELDQTSRETILEGGRSGPALVPGKPEESLIMLRVTSDDDERRMPPTEPLSDEEIEALRRWIADGAVWTDAEGTEG